MGDATTPKDHILVLLPIAVPAENFDKIQKHHPGVTIKFHFLDMKKMFAGQPHLQDVPDRITPPPSCIACADNYAEDFLDATILVTLMSYPKDVKLLKNVRLIHLFSAGADSWIGTPIWNDTKIPITNSSGVHGPQIAEWVTLQILSSNHKQQQLLEWQKKHYWGPHSELGFPKDYVGQRLGVLGYGAIGRQCKLVICLPDTSCCLVLTEYLAARIFKALGGDVIAYTASPRTTPESKIESGYIVPGTGDEEGRLPSAWYSGLDKASLHKFLKQDIDILLVAVPLTPQTRHFLGAEEFEILGKKNALIVNVARGAILKTDDLITAVQKSPKEGGLRGAALDVTEPEPLPADSELWDVENIVITPHISALSDSIVERVFEIVDVNLTNLEQGKPLINQVSRRKGY